MANFVSRLFARTRAAVTPPVVGDPGAAPPAEGLITVQPDNQPESRLRDQRKNVEINVGKACNNRCVFCIDGLPKREDRSYMPFPQMQHELRSERKKQRRRQNDWKGKEQRHVPPQRLGQLQQERRLKLTLRHRGRLPLLLRELEQNKRPKTQKRNYSLQHRMHLAADALEQIGFSIGHEQRNGESCVRVDDGRFVVKHHVDHRFD